MSATLVAVLAFDGVSLFQLSIPAVTFGVVNGPPDFPDYEVRYCAENPGRIRSDQGLEILVQDGLETLENAPIVVVPAWPDPETPAPESLTLALRQAAENGALIVGLCFGAFVLGDAGLLDGREATTHWSARKTFARRFPHARFREDVLYVSDGNILTSAGTVAAIDCGLHLVRERHGSETANRLARMLVTPPHRQGGQSQYIERPIPQVHCEDRLPSVLEWARDHLAEKLDLNTLADRAFMSRRTFTRRFREQTGTNFSTWLNIERTTRAQELLETTDLTIEHVAEETGFGTPLSMRLQFRNILGTSPSEYRRTFR